MIYYTYGEDKNISRLPSRSVLREDEIPLSNSKRIESRGMERPSPCFGIRVLSSRRRSTSEKLRMDSSEVFGRKINHGSGVRSSRMFPSNSNRGYGQIWNRETSNRSSRRDKVFKDSQAENFGIEHRKETHPRNENKVESFLRIIGVELEGRSNGSVQGRPRQRQVSFLEASCEDSGRGLLSPLWE